MELPRERERPRSRAISLGLIRSGKERAATHKNRETRTYLLLLLTLVGQIFSALAFWGDYFYVPTLLVFAAITLAVDQVSGGDSYFATNPEQVEVMSWLGVVALSALAAALAVYAASLVQGWPGIQAKGRWAACAAGGAVAGMWFCDQLPCGPSRMTWLATSLVVGVIAGVGLVCRAWALARQGQPLGSAYLGAAVTVLTALAAFLIGVRVTPDDKSLLTAWRNITVQPIATPGRLTRLDLKPELRGGKELRAVCDMWKIPTGRDSKQTLVVVTAAGGGIQSAAWTTQVLWGLCDRYREPFADSVKILSGVSGGSLGVAHSMQAWDYGTGTPQFSEALRAARLTSRESSLEAVAFGATYTDLMASILPPLPGPLHDRGNFLERAWDEQFRRYGGKGDYRLSRWIERVAQGSHPIPIFNSTMSENGRRLVIAPVYRRLPDPAAGYVSPPPEAVDFYHLYPPPAVKGASPAHDPDVATVVRLSATFPFISPLARSYYPCPQNVSRGSQLGYLKNCHSIDGGYVDNEGMFTALEWVSDVLEWSKTSGRKPQFERILFVRILPFPPEEPPVADEDDEPRNAWTNAVFGPVSTLNSVRTTSMADRNAFGLAEFKKHAAKVKVDFVQFVFQAWRKTATKDAKGETEAGYVTPLSWQLTPRQKFHVDAAWEEIKNAAQLRPGDGDNPLVVMDKYFNKRE